MNDKAIKSIVGWRLEHQMVKFREVAAAAEAAERERCAKLCDDAADAAGKWPPGTQALGAATMAEELAAKIRALPPIDQKP